MTRREELAAQFMAGMLADPALDKTVPSWCVERAFTYADFFLAACEPEPEPEREPQGPCCDPPPPDAVWTVETLPHGFQVRYADGTGMLVMPNDMACTYDQLSRITAGRARVELELRVREVQP